MFEQERGGAVEYADPFDALEDPALFGKVGSRHARRTTEPKEATVTTTRKSTKPTAPKATAKPTVAPKATNGKAPAPITDALVKKVLGMRRAGKSWNEISDALGQPRTFPLRIRPLMKKADPASVLAIGPGSPTYGTKKA